MADGISAIFVIIGINCVRKGETARGLFKITLSLVFEFYFIPLSRTDRDDRFLNKSI